MATYKQQVIKIEPKEGDQGPYLMVSFKKKDGTVKVRKVWGDLAKPFTATGLYDVSFDDETHYLTGAKLVGESSGTGGSPSGHTSPDSSRSRDIRAQTAMKAAAEVLAGKPIDEVVEKAYPVMKAFFDAADKLSAPEAGE